MFELNKLYGWSKFIVVVPSIAIREGVQKSFETMREHFKAYYGKIIRPFVYNSKKLSDIDNYSQSADINVMIINIQAFNARGKDARRIRTELDDFGTRRPIDVIKANRPIVILDEPQKMGGKATQESLKEFNPLFCLNYSATHKQHHDLVYVLDALDAYNQKLVKKIEVKGFDIKNLRGTDSYLFLESIVAKIAMDIVAKKIPADENGVRIAELDEMSYRKKLWSHTPLTDFWRIGSGYAKRLEKMQIFTMGDLARFSEHGEDLLFRMFGVAAELLIDHAWGYESCTMQAIKSYQPKGHSISQGQVLPCPYNFEKGRLIVREMTELLVLDLVRKKMVADQIVLMVGYDHTGIPETYQGELKKDRYGKKVPKAAHGSVNLGKQTSSTKRIMEKVLFLYDRIVDPELQVRRMSITANHVIPEGEVQEEAMQYSLFDDVEAQEQKRKQEQESLKKEHQLQEAILSIKDRYGKNAILKGMNFREGATTIERNEQVGGHKA